KSLVRVGENPLSRRDTVRKRELSLFACAAQGEALPAVARVVMYGLKDRSIRTHKPSRSTKRVLLSSLTPPFVSRFFAGPPQQLQIHHRVNDRVIPVHAPRCNQLRFWIEELLQPLGRAKSAGAKCGIAGQIESHRRRVVIQESCIMILQRLLADQLRTP